jgi:uncharacterized protein YecE (DUF72 family)
VACERTNAKWNYNGIRLEEFISALPHGNNYVFEFRNRDWLREEMFALLRKYHIGFCIHNMPESITPELLTAKISYIRFPGYGEKYGGGYPEYVLDQWAAKLVDWHRSHIKVFVYFNNDIGGFAPKNALMLKRLIKEKM